MHQLRTIGVYGFDASSFLESLNKGGVSMLLDVRQRRGVRGTQYAWANSQRLQASLAAAGSGYRHHRDLAPTTELRQLQYAEDARQGVGKRTRRELAPAYVDRYTAEVLDHADLEPIVSALPTVGEAALFCVERDPESCHRSLIAQRLAEQQGVTVGHLRPR